MRASREEREGFFDAGLEGRVGGEGLVEFKDDGRRSGELLEGLCCGGPVDSAIAGPEVLVFLAVVVVGVDGGDAGVEGGDGLVYAASDVSMAKVDADTDCIEMTHLEDFYEVLGRSGFADKVFNQEANVKGTGKGA